MGGSGGASGDCKCGLAKRRTRIVGGVETEVNEWPWQAGMVWSGSSSVFCGATVISDEWILTASHCVDGTNPAEIQVLLGEHDYWDSGESSMTRMDISEIIMHADYDSNTVDQDFALLKMARKLDWSANENIRPACLPSAGAGDYDQWMSTVTGWGTTSSGGSTSNVLLEVDVKVISNSSATAPTEESRTTCCVLQMLAETEAAMLARETQVVPLLPVALMATAEPPPG